MPKTKDGGFFLDDTVVNTQGYTVKKPGKPTKDKGDGKTKDKKPQGDRK